MAGHFIHITKPDLSSENIFSGGYESDAPGAPHFANPSVVLKIEAGFEVGIEPHGSGTIIGHSLKMKTWFGMTLLYAE